MLNKLNKLSIAAYVRAASFVDGLKNDERGLSGIVVAVLLILIAVLAIVMLWGSLEQFLGDMWGDVTDAAEFEGGSSFGD